MRTDPNQNQEDGEFLTKRAEEWHDFLVRMNTPEMVRECHGVLVPGGRKPLSHLAPSELKYMQDVGILAWTVKNE